MRKINMNITNGLLMGKIKTNRYGFQIPDHWIECRGCPDMVNEDISDIYSYGYCSNCLEKIPSYIPHLQWEKWLRGVGK